MGKPKIINPASLDFEGLAHRYYNNLIQFDSDCPISYMDGSTATVTLAEIYAISAIQKLKTPFPATHDKKSLSWRKHFTARNIKLLKPESLYDDAYFSQAAFIKEVMRKDSPCKADMDALFGLDVAKLSQEDKRVICSEIVDTLCKHTKMSFMEEGDIINNIHQLKAYRSDIARKMESCMVSFPITRKQLAFEFVAFKLSTPWTRLISIKCFLLYVVSGECDVWRESVVRRYAPAPAPAPETKKHDAKERKRALLATTGAGSSSDPVDTVAKQPKVASKEDQGDLSDSSDV